MAKAVLPIALCLSLAILLPTPSLARRQQRTAERSEQCRIEQLEAVEATNRYEAEAGVSEFWDHTQQQFQCAGVSAARHTIQPGGLLLPVYSGAPQLIYVEEGEGIGGLVVPGCPESYSSTEESTQRQIRGREGRGTRRSSEEERESRGREERGTRRSSEEERERRGREEREPRRSSEEERQRRGREEREPRRSSEEERVRYREDQHQKVHRIKPGDLLALPTGIPTWCYNDGDRPLVVVNIVDIANYANQLDYNPREFFLGGSSLRERGGQSARQVGSFGNIFDGFDVELLADALNVDRETARKMQSKAQEGKGFVVRVEEGLKVAAPRSYRVSEEEEERMEERRGREERREGEERREREREERRRRETRGSGNGVEEVLCNMRFRENIGNPQHSDVYSREGGHLTTLNAMKLPVLWYLQLSAERGHLFRNAILAPHWNVNAHSIMYVLKGSARVQIADSNGKSVFDGQARRGQMLVIPQNFAVIKHAEDDDFEWISFKTDDKAVVNQISGRGSTISGIPIDVLANSFQMSREEARDLKESRREQVALLPASSVAPPRTRRNE